MRARLASGILAGFALAATPARALTKQGYWGPELAAWSACRTDADCVLVENEFPCRCGQLSVNRAHLKDFEAESARMRAYWKDRSPTLLCEPCARPAPKVQRPRCRASACVAEPPA